MQLFPTPSVDVVALDSSLQQALDGALASHAGFRGPCTLVALEADGSRPMAHVAGDEMHFSASLLKVAAMFAAYELRRAVREVAADLGSRTTKARFFSDVAATLDSRIVAAAAKIPAIARVTKANAVPSYRTVFVVTESDGALEVSFAPAFEEHLSRMIAQSDNASAGTCVRGVGYGYLAGALVAAGFFDPRANKGIWLAGDYVQQAPYFRIPSVNDGPVAQATTTNAMARLFVDLHDSTVADSESCDAMLALLASAVAVPEVFIGRASALDFSVTHTKVGVGPLKAKNGGANVCAEGSIVRHDGTGRTFVVVWQNFVFGADGFDPVGHLVRDTLRAYTG